MKAAAAGTDEIIRLKSARGEEGKRQKNRKHIILFPVGGGQRAREGDVCKEN